MVVIVVVELRGRPGLGMVRAGDIMGGGTGIRPSRRSWRGILILILTPSRRCCCPRTRRPSSQHQGRGEEEEEAARRRTHDKMIPIDIQI